MIEVTNKRLTILSKTQIDDLYQLPHFSEEERAFYFSLDEEERKEMESLRSIDSQIHFILQLGYFRTKNLFFEITFLECIEDIEYISNRYFAGVQITKISLSKRTIFNNYSRILKLVSYTFMNKDMKEKLRQKSLELARICVDPCYIFDHLILFLEENRIVLPGYSSLQDIIGQSLTLETQRLHILIKQHIPESIDTTLKKLLISGNREKQDQDKDKEAEKEFKKIYGITLLKRDAKGFNYKEMIKEIEKKKASEALFHSSKKIIPYFEISPKNISYYASLSIAN